VSIDDNLKTFKDLCKSLWEIDYVSDYKVWFDLFHFKFTCRNYSAKNYMTGETIKYSRLS
ncbi:MAG: hypothetical protein WCS51_02505, partial [Bacilli bacterium]